MVRTQIQLSEGQYRGLRRWAQRLGISLSEAVRRCVTERLAREEEAPSREERVRAALAVCGKYGHPEGVMRSLGLRDVLALDHHFAEAGCRLLPPAEGG